MFICLFICWICRCLFACLFELCSFVCLFMIMLFICSNYVYLFVYLLDLLLLLLVRRTRQRNFASRASPTPTPTRCWWPWSGTARWWRRPLPCRSRAGSSSARRRSRSSRSSPPSPRRSPPGTRTSSKSHLRSLTTASAPCRSAGPGLCIVSRGDCRGTCIQQGVVFTALALKQGQQTSGPLPIRARFKLIQSVWVR